MMIWRGVLLLLAAAASMQIPGGVRCQIHSNSILVALLDSRYTELAELVEKALLLPHLERVVSTRNITIFAPENNALERDLDPEFKLFLLQPSNLNSLQTLLLHHILPVRIPSQTWPASSLHPTLSPHSVKLTRSRSGIKSIDLSTVHRPNDIIRPDGVIHGIQRLITPRAVQDEFNARRTLRSISAVKPQPSPEVDFKTNHLKKTFTPSPIGSPLPLPIYSALSPSLAPASAPAPGPIGQLTHFDGESLVKDFILTLIQYGGYTEMADILVNLTSLASEMGKLVSEGYVLTILAPNDEAMSKLTTEDLVEPRAADLIVYYHVIPEYQTEESMYNAVRRFEKVSYSTLRMPYMVTAEESDGSVKFGKGEGSAYLFDPDIYTDGRISVQGIDAVLFPPNEESARKKKSVKASKSVKAVEQRRGKLMEMVCGMLGAYFSSCR